MVLALPRGYLSAAQRTLAITIFCYDFATRVRNLAFFGEIHKLMTPWGLSLRNIAPYWPLNSRYSPGMREREYSRLASRLVRTSGISPSQ